MCLIQACIASGPNFDVFDRFNLENSKTYESAGHFEMRRTIFMNNYNKMIEHNERYEAGEVSWWKKIHPDMDLTDEEWSTKRLSGGLPIYNNQTHFGASTMDSASLVELAKTNKNPEEFDWVSKGAVSSVKDQASCGSCAAFAVIGAVESCYSILTGEMDDDLSEQHLVDCAYHHVVEDDEGSWEATGCSGAWPVAYMDWLLDEYNQEEAGYKYVSGKTHHHMDCTPKKHNYHKEAHVSGMENIWNTDEKAMESLLQINPVVTVLMATSDWSSYGGGVLVDSICCDAATDDQCVYFLNHAVLVVGYGHDNESGLDYWLIKNSWGTRFGEDGYLKLKKGTGHCGIGYLNQNIPKCAIN